MAQSSGFTTILLYASGTPTNVPSAGNLTSSAAGAELALNYADGKLFYKDSGGVVQTLATKATGTIGGSTTQVQYNLSGALAGSANLTFDGTSLTLGGNPTLTAGTANGVLYLNGSKVATSGSGLTFDGTTLTSTTYIKTGGGAASNSARLMVNTPNGSAAGIQLFQDAQESWIMEVPVSSTALRWTASGTEYMRLTSTGLGIGTSSPGQKLDVSGADGVRARVVALAGGTPGLILSSSGNTAYTIKAGNADNSLRIDQDGNDRITLASGGNVGIGTSSPGQRLAVRSADNLGSTNIARFESNNAAQGVVVRFASVLGDGGNTSFGTLTNNAVLIAVNNSEVARFDTSGNLGLGVTPSAWNAAFKAVEFNNGSLSATSNGPYLALNAYFASNWIYKATAAASHYLQTGGQHQWFTAPSGTAGNVISWTQAMTLDASGNLGVGLTSPSARVQTSAADGAYLLAVSGTTKGFRVITDANATTIQGVDTTLTTSYQPLALGGLDLRFQTNGTTERARITSGGDLAVGTTGAINNNVVSAYASSKNAFVAQVTNNANSNFQGFNSSGVATFQVLGSGIAQLLSGAAGTLNYLDVGRTAGETRIGVAASINDFLSGTAIGDSVFYKVNAGNAWYGTAGSGAAVFATNNQERARITSTGNVVAGGSIALATNATDGFLYVPTCGGTPTGTPTAITGMAPIVVDTTNNKLYFYSGGAWRDAGP